MGRQRLLAFRNAPYAGLISGQVISQLGTTSHQVAAIVYIRNTTNEPLSVGLLLILSGVLSLIVSPVAGSLADKGARAKILIGADLLAGLAALLVALVFFITESPPVALLYACGLIFSALGLLLGPAFGSAIPLVVQKADLREASSTSKILTKMAEFAGNTLAAALIKTGGVAIVFLLNGLSFLFAAGASSLVRKRIESAPTPDKPPTRLLGQITHHYRNFGVSVVDLFQDGGAKNIFIMAGLINLIHAPIMVLLPFLGKDLERGTVDAYGAILGAQALGSLLGYSLFGGRWFATVKPENSATSAVLLMSLLFCLLGFSNSLYVSLLIMLLIGLCHGSWSVLFESSLQRSIPQNRLGSAFAAFRVIASCAAPIGYVVGSVFGDMVVSRDWFGYFISALGFLMFMATSFILMKKEARAFFSA